MFISFICPFLYSLLMGITWSAVFKKKFADSLAPAFMLHIIVILVSGLVFNNLSLGIYGGIIISFAIFCMFIIKNVKKWEVIKEYCIQYWSSGLFFLTVFYLFCFLGNTGKRFTEYDEFSHWGVFLKECLRLNRLFCTSSLPFNHKDYVPAITLFETIWCRLSGRFREADAYRAIQIFMFSMLLPLVERFSEHSETVICDMKKKGLRILLPLSAFLLVLLIPLLFHIYGFRFYHSIYCDVVIGLEFFYCTYIVFYDEDSFHYQAIILAIAGTVFVLTKMIALVLLAMTLAFYIVKYLLTISYFPIVKKNNTFLFIPIIMIPVGFWLWFNHYVDGYVPNTGSIQSFDGIDLVNILNVLFSPERSSIPYIIALRDIFFHALWSKQILIMKYSSFGFSLMILVLTGLALSFMQANRQAKMKTQLACIWLFMAGIAYALLMYCMYATAISGPEAMGLASFERYMSSFLIMAIYILLAIYFESGIYMKHQKGYSILLLLVLVALLVFQTDYEQLLPGTFSGDEKKTADVIASAAQIIDYTPEGSKIYYIRCGDDGSAVNMLRYYCNPRIVRGGNLGPPLDDADHRSVDLTPEEFVHLLSEYDYLYFDILDEAFLQKYSVVFKDSVQLNNNVIYKIIGLDPLITLEEPKE